ncbi:hypothetical protein [Pelagibacterium montanilacus]|uniref:hypothetical protein n=1 Tax=Pelagibacterium montanilacus TaxID=2185280 RepID=UPI000F8C8044|nr:hypothetical protein [Pelagibacterium montanilacus]
MNKHVFDGNVRTPHHDTRPVSLVHLKRHVKWPEVKALVRYIDDFGSGRTRALARDRGWCLAITSPDDLLLLKHQHASFIDYSETVSVAVPSGRAFSMS